MTSVNESKIIREKIREFYNKDNNKLLNNKEVLNFYSKIKRELSEVNNESITEMFNRHLFYMKKDKNYKFNTYRKCTSEHFTTIKIENEGDNEEDNEFIEIIEETAEENNKTETEELVSDSEELISETDNNIFIKSEKNSPNREVVFQINNEEIKSTEDSEELLDLNTDSISSESEESELDKELYCYPSEKYTVKKYNDAKNGPYGSQWVHDDQVDDEYNEEITKRAEQFDKLKAIILPEQRTPEWFAMRDKKITASDGGCVVGVNKHEKTYNFIVKKLDPPPFKSNKFCYHGTKLEEIATMVYEYRMNVKVDEFGLMGHSTIDFLGASPDGIVSRYKLDKKHKTKYVGRMLEIKCPLSRKINKTGEIYNHICPAYYWVQVQQQLECCDLEECDFWQCDIKEYKTREEFMRDTDPNEPFRSKKVGLEKGCLIQLIPIEMVEKSKRSYKDYDEVVWNSSKFLYPPKIEMTPYQCDNWIANIMSKLHNTEFKNGVAKLDSKNHVNFNPKKYAFDKVIYWYINDSHNVTIQRDREWFKKHYEVYKKIWGYVTFFRNNEDKKKLFLDYVNSLNKKMNDKIMKVCEEIYDCENPKYKENIDRIIKETYGNKNKPKYEDEVEYMFIEED